jgi:adenosylhomocysteine nucleosidase
LVRVGVITGTDREAECLDVIPARERPFILHTGGGAMRTETAARDLIGQGCDAIASIGTAGGLEPGLSPGTLILPPRILADGEAFATDAAWRAALEALAAREGIAVAGGDIAHSETVLHGVADKAALRQATGAQAVDMESLPAARVAAQAGVRFMAIRVVIDDAGRALPHAVSAAMVENGEVRLEKLLAALIRRPQDIPLLISLGRASTRAFRTLRRVAARTGPGLGL